jgi:hypothetical protein
MRTISYPDSGLKGTVRRTTNFGHAFLVMLPLICPAFVFNAAAQNSQQTSAVNPCLQIKAIIESKGRYQNVTVCAAAIYRLGWQWRLSSLQRWKTSSAPRRKPALIDWNRDGLIAVIGHDADEKNLFLFKRYRDSKTGELKLANGIALSYTNGAPVVPAVWHRYTKYFNAGDWNGKGVFDIWLSASDEILYLENVGTNEKPSFLPPVRLSKDGMPIRVDHHVSTPFPVDWDHDGKMDLLVSGESGLFHLFRRGHREGIEHKIFRLEKIAF